MQPDNEPDNRAYWDRAGQEDILNKVSPEVRMQTHGRQGHLTDDLVGLLPATQVWEQKWVEP